MTTRMQVFVLVEAVGKGAYAGKRATATYEAVRAILVSAEAESAADGRSWATATAFTNALARVGTDWEIWMKAGTYVRTSQIQYKGSGAYSFYGGFSGNDAWVDELASDPYAVWDGNNALSGFFWFENSTSYQYEFIFDHIHFTRMTGAALSRREGASLRVRHCKFTNSHSTANSARGIHCGSYYARRSFVSCEDCLFQDLQRVKANQYPNGGMAIYSDKSITIYLDGCTFVSNNIPFTSTDTWHQEKSGAAISICGDCVLKAKNSRFVCHRSDMTYNNWGTGGPSTVYLSGNCNGSAFENCLFLGNEDKITQTPTSNCGGALCINAASAAQTVTVTRCTFAYNLHAGLNSAAGLTVQVGHADISDSIFYGNVVGSLCTAGADLAVKNGSATVTRSLFATGAQTEPGKYFSAVDATTLVTTDLVYGDPQFVSPVADYLACLESSSSQTPAYPVTPHYTYFATASGDALCALDAHLKSPGVYYDNAGVRHEDEEVTTSAAILADGTNLGCYGGTSEQSVLPAVHPVVTGLAVTWQDGYSQPRISFTPAREYGSAYNAQVTVVYQTEGGEEHRVVLTNVPSDVPFSYLGDVCLTPHAKYTVSVTVEAAGASAAANAAGTVDAEYSPYWQKGGDAAKVLHVRADATGKGTGDNWFDAMTDFHAALSYLTETRNELWLAGDVTLTKLASACAPKADAVVRGGFAGTENAASSRAAGTLSTLDGDSAYTPLTLANAHAVTLERIRFTHSLNSGLVKTGAGDLTLADCAFTANATNRVSVNGRGAKVTGTAGTTRVTVTNCVFAGNMYLTTNQVGAVGYGFGLYLENVARAEIVDSLFVTNGIDRASQWPSFDDWSGKDTTCGTAIYATSAPITARRCRFVANMASSSNNSSGSGTVVLAGAGGGTVFENCLWLGNAEENYTSGTAGRTRDLLGALWVTLSDWSATVALTNCTIAYNLAETLYGPAGLYVQKGDVRLVNSIVWGNTVSAGCSRGADVYVASNSSLRASYSLLATNSANYVTIAAPTSDYGTVEWGPGMVWGDPLFVTDAAAFLPHVSGGTPAIPKGGSTITFGKSNEAAKAICAFDVHCRGKQGYLDERTGRAVYAPGLLSPAVDAGDPATDCRAEARPNGDRVNQGYYGNTPYATRSGGGVRLLAR